MQNKNVPNVDLDQQKKMAEIETENKGIAVINVEPDFRILIEKQRL